MLQRQRPGARIVLVCLCVWGLANVRLIVSTVRESRNPLAGYTPSAMIPRFAPLAQWLPEDAEASYLLDEENADLKTHAPAARRALALLTCAVAADHPADNGLPSGDRSTDRPETPPKIAGQQGWALVADLHNGVRLYRTREPGP